MRPPRAPWILSGLVHATAAALVLLWAFGASRPAPGPVRMRFLAGPTAEARPAGSSSSWWSDRSPGAQAAAEVSAPAWAATAEAPTAPAAPVTAAARLDELLGPESSPSAPADTAGAPGAGWVSAAGEGYRAPPLPPPGLVPAGGGQWVLELRIPAGGGPADSFEGLDSGHPDLDRWLEGYLRTVSFPASLDGREYRLRWSLRLETGRPR